MAKKLVLQGQIQVWKFLHQPQLMTDAAQLCIFSLYLHFYGKCRGIPEHLTGMGNRALG